MGNKSTRIKAADISGIGVILHLELEGRTHIELNIRGSAAADYALDVNRIRDADTEADWMQGVNTYTGATDYDDVLRTGAEILRLRVTTAAGVGDTADVLLQAGGGQ